MHISENKENPVTAKQLAFRCNLCGKLAFAVFPYEPTAQQRMHVMKEALDEHRKVCMAANSEVERIYQIMYPRSR